MQHHNGFNVITLTDHPTFEKKELSPANQSGSSEKNKGMDFIETLFRFLGGKRQTVFSFIRMKLERRKRDFFRQELELCKNVREEARCVKKYIGHLKVNDTKALLMSLPVMLPGKIEALIYHGEDLPENRLMKFSKTFGLKNDDALFCMLFLLMTKDESGKTTLPDMGRAI